jgi:hypothetical protein
MTDPLSPAAQAVMFAYAEHNGGIEAVLLYERQAIAAALRAAAAHCHSQEIREADYTTRRWICVDELLAIAAELEAGHA